jgi:hypothetical protein
MIIPAGTYPETSGATDTTAAGTLKKNQASTREVFQYPNMDIPEVDPVYGRVHCEL